MSLPQSHLPFRVGAARIGINPTKPVWLAGYGFRTSPATGRISDLFVRALAIEETGGTSALILSIDHLGMGRELVEEIAEQIGHRFGISRERLLIACSHTHSAPVADHSLSDIYPMSSFDWSAVEHYASLLKCRIEECVEKAFANLTPARLHYGKSVAGFGVNRRRLFPGCDTFPAPVDHDVPVLRVTDECGAVKAVVYGYACHPTTLRFDKTSADYPGFASEELEKMYPEAVCLFVAGCGADINPLPRDTQELAAAYGYILATAVKEACQSPALVELTSPIEAVREEIFLPFEQCPNLDTLKDLEATPDPIIQRWARRWRDALEKGTPIPTGCQYPIHVWKFGSALTWVILAAEVCTDYSLRIKAALGHGKTWASAYSNELIGYIPSERLLDEGGYEGGESKVVFALPGEFKPGIEAAIVHATLRLAGVACGKQ